MKRKVKRLGLSRETIQILSLQVASGGLPANTVDRTVCITNCPVCGVSNYITCVGGVC